MKRTSGMRGQSNSGCILLNPFLLELYPKKRGTCVVQYPQTISQLRYLYPKENVLQVDYDCAGLSTFDGPFEVVVHDLTDPQ